MQLIPLTRDGRQQVDAVLGGQRLLITIYWSHGPKKWFIDATLPPGRKLVSGRQITMFSALLQSPHFSGEIFCLPIGAHSGEPERDAWGITHEMAYRP